MLGVFHEPYINREGLLQPAEYFLTSDDMARSFFSHCNIPCKVFCVEPPRSEMVTSYEQARRFFSP